MCMFGGEIKRQIRRDGEKGEDQGRERHILTKLEGQDRERERW